MIALKKQTLVASLALLTPLCQLALLLWVYCLYRIQAQQPTHWPFTILALLITVGSFSQIAIWLRALWTGRERLRELRWLCLILLPSVALLWGGLYTHRITSNRIIPDDLMTRWMGSAGISLADLELSLRYPIIVRGKRVDMYCQQELPDAQELVRQMDEHIADLERRIGRVGTTKARWVRGNILGRSNFQLFGYAMSDFELPGKDQAPKLQYVDRHELAHFVLSQYMNADGAPPFMLIEGWAQAMSVPSESLVVDAWRTRYIDKGVWQLKDLTTSPWYHYDRDYVYTIGGAFVDYLLRHYGEKTFCDLYALANEQHFAQQFQQVYHKSLAEIEPEFWAEMETLTPETKKKNDHWVDPDAYTQDGGRTLWLDIVQAANARSEQGDFIDDGLKITSESTGGGDDNAYRHIERYWLRGDELWNRSQFVSNGQLKEEILLFASKDTSFALQRTDEGNNWLMHPEYDIDDSLQRARWIASRAKQPRIHTNYIESLAQWLGQSSLHNYDIEDVQETLIDNDRSQIEIQLKLKPNRKEHLETILLLLDDHFRITSAQTQYATLDGKTSVYSTSYTWADILGQTRLVESVTSNKLLEAPFKEIAHHSWSYKRCDENDYPPFKQSDFKVTHSWSEWIPEPSVESGIMLLTIVDALALCICTIVLSRQCRSV